MENFVYFLKLGWGEIYSIFLYVKNKEKPRGYKRERELESRTTQTITYRTNTRKLKDKFLQHSREATKREEEQFWGII